MSRLFTGFILWPYLQQSHHCVMERKPGSKHTSNVKVVTLYASIREAIEPKRKERSIT